MAISVKVRFLCRDITGNARNGEYLIPEKSAITDLMDLIQNESGPFIEDYEEHVLFLVNGRPSGAETVLNDSDQVMVTAVVYGG